MPVIPNFSAWGPSANEGANFTAGVNAGASIARAQAEIGIANQRLQQQATLANMEFAAKQEQRQQAFLLEQQQLEIEKQYKTAQLGLEKQRLDVAQSKVDVEAQRAARQFAAQEQYRRRFTELGGTEDAARQAMMEIGPEAGGSSFNAALRTGGVGEEDNSDIGTSSPAAGMPEGWSVFKRGRNSAQLVPPPKARVDASIPPTILPGTDKLVLNNGQVVSRGTSPAVDMARTELRALIEQDAKRSPNQERSVAKEESGKKLSELEKADVAEFKKRRARIAELKSIITSGGVSATTTGNASIPASMTPRKSRWTPVEE